MDRNDIKYIIEESLKRKISLEEERLYFDIIKNILEDINSEMEAGIYLRVFSHPEDLSEYIQEIINELY